MELFVFVHLLLHADQRNLGMSMKVEKSTLDQVKKRFEFNKKAKEQKEKEYGVSLVLGEGTTTSICISQDLL